MDRIHSNSRRGQQMARLINHDADVIIDELHIGTKCRISAYVFIATKMRELYPRNKPATWAASCSARSM